MNDAAKFKEIWKAAYDPFANKADCVHYSFGFTEDGTRAHCREAYTSAKTALQHLADVDAALKAVLDGPAELERLEVHGPKAEIDQLIEPLTPFGCKFFVCEWGFRPAKPAMDPDTVVHLYPYFTMKNVYEFKKIWGDAYPGTKAAQAEEKSHQYAFSFDENGPEKVASCRESYGDAEGVKTHLGNVDAPLKGVLDGPADLLRLEVHGPQSECDKLKEALSPLGCVFYVTEWGFRNACPKPSSTPAPFKRRGSVQVGAWTDVEKQAVLDVRTKLHEEHNVPIKELGEVELITVTLNAKCRVDEACQKFLTYKQELLELYGISDVWANQAELGDQWHRLAVAGRDEEGRGVMWINGGATEVSEEQRCIRACCLYFFAAHADLKSLREGISLVIDTSNAPKEKVGNEKKLQVAWQNFPTRPQHIFILGTNLITRVAINALIAIASLFAKNKVIARIKFAEVKDIVKLWGGEADLPQAHGGAPKGETSGWVASRLAAFPKMGLKPYGEEEPAEAAEERPDGPRRRQSFTEMGVGSQLNLTAAL